MEKQLYIKILINVVRIAINGYMNHRYNQQVKQYTSSKTMLGKSGRTAPPPPPPPPPPRCVTSCDGESNTARRQFWRRILLARSVKARRYGVIHTSPSTYRVMRPRGFKITGIAAKFFLVWPRRTTAISVPIPTFYKFFLSKIFPSSYRPSGWTRLARVRFLERDLGFVLRCAQLAGLRYLAGAAPQVWVAAASVQWILFALRRFEDAALQLCKTLHMRCKEESEKTEFVETPNTTRCKLKFVTSREYCDTWQIWLPISDGRAWCTTAARLRWSKLRTK